MKSKLFKQLRLDVSFWFLIGASILFVVLRTPSLIEPYWYGDEGIYEVIGKALNSGWILYQDIWDNKPPILYFIYAIFNGDQFFIRFFSLLFGLFSLIAFYLLGKRIFRNNLSVIISTLLYAFLFATPLLEGNIANAENFMHLPILLSAIMIWNFIENRNIKTLLVGGILLSIAFMTKIVAVFEFGAFLLFLFLIINKPFELKNGLQYFTFQKIKPLLVYFVGFISFFIFFVFYFAFQGALPEFISGAFSRNIDYVGVGNNFLFPMGILFLKTILLLSGITILVLVRKRLSQTALFLFLWMLFALFSTFFSHRPYTHYILMSALPFSYLVGYVFENKKMAIVTTSIVLVVVGIIYFNFPLNKELVRYYTNYFDFISGKKTVQEYQAYFDAATPRDYAVANFIKTFTDKDDTVFVWSDSGQIYALSNKLPPGKYIVSYHITYYDDAVQYMMNRIEKTQPKFIIKTKDSPELQYFLPAYELKYKIEGAAIYERKNRSTI